MVMKNHDGKKNRLEKDGLTIAVEPLYNGHLGDRKKWP